MSLSRVQHRRLWRAVSAMFSLNGALFGIWASRIPAVAERHALSPGDLGLLLLLMAAGALAAFPFAGHAADQRGAYRVTCWVAFGYVGALGLIALAPGTWSLAGALVFFGATHGGMDVTMNTWAGEAERRMGRPVMSSFHAMFSLGAGLGAASGFAAVTLDASIAQHIFVAAPLFAVLAFFMARVEWQDSPAKTSGPAPMFAIPRGPLFFVGLFAFCSSLGEGAMADWSAIFLVVVAQATEAQAALGYAVFSAAMVVMRLLGDRITQHFGAIATARSAGAIACLGVLCAIGFGTVPATLLGFALMGIGYSVIVPLAFSRAANDSQLNAGIAIASVSTLGYGGMLLGPPLIGFLSEATSIRAAFGVLALLAGSIIVLASALRR